jgi:uncharacterized protein (TIGR02996 family)
VDERRAFLQAIIETPDDDAPRLVFADWLDDHGEPDRAELIRTQCALVKIEPDDPRRPLLERREDDLLHSNARGWLKREVPAAAREGARFRRGFVEHVVAAKVETLADRAGELLERLPITSVRFGRAHGADLEALAAVPFVALRNLHLFDFRADSTEALLAAAFLPHLRKLRLSAWTQSMRVASVAALLESPVPARLTHLDLDSFCLHDVDVQRLLDSEVAGRLEYLRLDVVQDREVRILAASDRLVNLRSLDLNDDVLLTDVAVRAIAESPHLGRLRRLNLRTDHNLTDDGIRALASCRGLGQLADVTMSGKGVTDDAIRALVESPNLPRLSRIEVSGVSILDDWPFWRPRRDRAARVLWVRDVRGAG